MKCYSCNIEVLTDDYLRSHHKAQRIIERQLGEDDPRSRVMLALIGTDHDLVSVEVTRRAMSGIVRTEL